MFEGWGDYFLMLGSSAAALIGLMFIVVTLTAGRSRPETEPGKHLYTSPVVWHLGVVVVLSGAAIAPTMTPAFFGAAGAGLALLGFGISARNSLGIARQRLAGGENTPFDVWWYGVAPAAVYIGLGAAAAAVLIGARWGSSAAAMSLMALLIVSIHAEWDLVTFLAPMSGNSDETDKPN